MYSTIRARTPAERSLLCAATAQPAMAPATGRTWRSASAAAMPTMPPACQRRLSSSCCPSRCEFVGLVACANQLSCPLRLLKLSTNASTADRLSPPAGVLRSHFATGDAALPSLPSDCAIRSAPAASGCSNAAQALLLPAPARYAHSSLRWVHTCLCTKHLSAEAAGCCGPSCLLQPMEQPQSTSCQPAPAAH